jgi:hypothetical protein
VHDGRNDRRMHRNNNRQFSQDLWEYRDDRYLHYDDDFPEPHRDDRMFQASPLRLDFPRFDGENPAGWSYKVKQFFEYYQTPLFQRIRMASFHMEGEALVWFQDADELGQFPTWDAFLQALLTRFGPAINDPMEALMTPRQSATNIQPSLKLFQIYCGVFLKNKKKKIIQSGVCCFLSGLKDDIHLSVQMLNPPNLVTDGQFVRLHHLSPLGANNLGFNLLTLRFPNCLNHLPHLLSLPNLLPGFPSNISPLPK